MGDGVASVVAAAVAVGVGVGAAADGDSADADADVDAADDAVAGVVGHVVEAAFADTDAIHSGEPPDGAEEGQRATAPATIALVVIV